MTVQHHRQVEPPFICADVRDIGHPNLIGLVLLELALQLVGRDLRGPDPPCSAAACSRALT
jgi:hypothetical protein